MLFHVNDMGLVPDGRFLEHASIEAGSPVLTDLDGNLRTTDVGKNIAIPGAADLDARIAELLERKNVANASMDAGSPTLTAAFPLDEDPFEESNVKQRITVAGAGLAGRPSSATWWVSSTRTLCDWPMRPQLQFTTSRRF